MTEPVSDVDARTTCSRCHREIDPDVCHCGDGRKYHPTDHTFIPMGCVCGYATPPVGAGPRVPRVSTERATALRESAVAIRDDRAHALRNLFSVKALPELVDDLIDEREQVAQLQSEVTRLRAELGQSKIAYDRIFADAVQLERRLAGRALGEEGDGNGR